MSTFLAMSVSGGALILVIAVLRALFAQRLPRRLLCALWAAALLRLLLPVFPPSPLSLFPAVESGGGEALSAVAVSTAAPQTVVSAVAPDAQVAASEAAAPAATRATAMPQTAPAPQAVAPTNAESPAPPVWPIVHGSVAALLLILLAVLYARGLRRFRASTPCEDGFARQWLARHPLRRPLRLRLCAAIDAPLTYGLLRPVILLPAGFDLSDREALDCVLRHELAHVRRFDALFKAALAVTACLHWFNPLVWVMLALANRDLELACDEQALRAAARERRRAYARALLRLEEMRARPLPLGSAFGKSGVEERIAAIVKRRPVSRAALALTLLLAALTLVAFTAPAAPASAPEATPTPAADSTEVGVSATPAPLTTPEQPALPETISLAPLPEEAFAVYAPYDLKYEDGVLRCGWSAVRCFTDTGLSGDYVPGTYLQNFHGNTDVFAIRDEYGTLTGLNWSFPGLDIYDACTQVIARAYAAEGLPTPTPLPERTPEPTPTAAFLAPLPEELAAYAPYGLTANEDGTLTYLGSSVRFLIDEAAGVELRWDTGGVGAYAVRDANGALTGLRAANWDEFAQETGTYEKAAPATYQTPPDRAADNWGVDRTTLAAYEPFGVTWVEDMPVYLGVPIRYIFDEAMQYAPLCVSRLYGQTDVYAVRDAGGGLTGLRAATAEEFAQNSAANYLAGASDAYRATPAAWPRAEVALLAAGIDAYAPYGLRVENGLPFFRDVSVRFFVDAGAGLNLMCYYWGEVDVLVERDESGAIAALRPSTRAEFEQKTQDSWEELRADYAAPEDANAAYNWNGRDELSTATGAVPVTLYAPYGLGMYDGRLYYGAEGVRSFLDEALGVEAYSHLPTATLDLRAVRDESGDLTGLRVATAEETAAIAGDLYEYEDPPQQGGPLGSVEAAEDWY